MKNYTFGRLFIINTLWYYFQKKKIIYIEYCETPLNIPFSPINIANLLLKNQKIVILLKIFKFIIFKFFW